MRKSAYVLVTLGVLAQMTHKYDMQFCICQSYWIQHLKFPASLVRP